MEALGKDDFALFHQPIRMLHEGAEPQPMAEVLVRLREEESALLPPGEFLPILEDLKMMPLLDGWVLEQVIERHAGATAPRYSVNLSRQTIQQPGFPQHFARLAAGARLPAGSVLFEFEEADVLDASVGVYAFAAQVRAAGAGIVVEGFGRNATSFDSVKALRPHFIKVDGCITRRVAADGAALDDLRAIVRFAEDMRIGVIAECVEEDAVLVALRSAGVRLAQGFGLARPEPLPKGNPRPLRPQPPCPGAGKARTESLQPAA